MLTTSETLLFSGHTEEKVPYSEWVALMLSTEVEKTLIVLE